MQEIRVKSSFTDKQELIPQARTATQNGNRGAATVIQYGHENTTQTTWQGSIGSNQDWSHHYAELISISQAMLMIQNEFLTRNDLETEQNRTVTIITASKSALQSIRNQAQRSGQHIVQVILRLAQELEKVQVRVRLVWIPTEGGIPGYETA